MKNTRLEELGIKAPTAVQFRKRRSPVPEKLIPTANSLRKGRKEENKLDVNNKGLETDNHHLIVYEL